MLALAAAALIAQSTGTIERDSFGVPHINAASIPEAFRLAGYAVAQDRMWQLEVSRRISRGRMAEIEGPNAVAADREFLLTGYTDEEMRQQFDGLPQTMRQAYEAYAEGINQFIDELRTKPELAPEFGRRGVAPEPWTVIDSVAISIRMGRMFGLRDGGELRNYLLYLYMKGQPGKDRAIDIIDDVAWQNDPRAIPTIAPADDPLRNNPVKWPTLNRQITEQHLNSIPPTNLLELAPAVRVAMREDTRRVAQAVGAPYKTGSYAVVVGPSRSRTGTPLLLTAPQMGWQVPSIIHELSITTPTLKVAGMNVPGIPGVLIGYTPNLAWGLTTGVADAEDIFFNPKAGDNGYRYGNETREIRTISRELKIKDRPAQTVVQRRTHLGPIVFESRVGNAVYSERSAVWMREMQGFASLFELYFADSPDDLDKFTEQIPLNFNFFFATRNGDFGWRFCGAIPLRAEGVDPRFPVPGQPATEWRGMIPAARMPHALNPKSGLIANWNNKPVAWWNNNDTPAWGRLFRNQNLVQALGTGKLGVDDLERAAWEIARRDEATMGAFLPLFRRALANEKLTGIEAEARDELMGYEGWTLDGSIGPVIHDAVIVGLREEMFLPLTGNFLSPATFNLVLQPSLVLNALEGQTKVDYRGGRSAEQIVRAAFKRAVERLSRERGADVAGWRYRASGIAIPDQPPIPYSARGSYIQITELRSNPFARSVLSPGVAQFGRHAFDQVPLARAWTYKPMKRWTRD